MSLADDIARLRTELSEAIAAAADEPALEAVRVAALGKKGSVSALLSTLGTMPPEERKSAGPLINGLITNESFLPSLDFPGTAEMMAKYQAKAPGLGIDPLGYGFAPFAYAVGQLIGKAVEETKSLDDGKLAAYLHSHTVDTVLGPLTFGADGEWAKSRMLFTQFQNVSSNGGLAQFKDPKTEVILWPAEYKKGELIYPYAKAKK